MYGVHFLALFLLASPGCTSYRAKCVVDFSLSLASPTSVSGGVADRALGFMVGGGLGPGPLPIVLT